MTTPGREKLAIEPVTEHADWRLVRSVKFRSGCELQYWNETLKASLLVESTARGRTFLDFVMPEFPRQHFDNEEDLLAFVAEMQPKGSAFSEISRLRTKLKAHGLDPDEDPPMPETERSAPQ